MGTVAVVGAAGIIGPAIVATLAEHESVERILVLDINEAGAREVAERHGRGRASAGALDIRDRGQAVAALDGADVLLNTASYRVNLDAMEVALAAGAHYVDLGGLFHVAREQLGLDERFREAGLLAVLGMGSTPGKTNVMAARAVELLGDDVERIVVGAAGRDPDPPAGPLVAPYAIETILDELSMPTPIIRDGEVEFVDPLTDAGTVEFGPPAGPAPTIYTIHSEQATFAESFGARNVSFQLSLNPVFLDKIRLLTQLGLAGTEPVDVRGTPVVPRQVLLALLARLPKASPSHHAFGIHRIEAHGREGGLAIVECVTTAVDRLDFGGGVLSTACPPAVVADMICRGELAAHTGVLPSERCVPYGPLFSRLERYGVSVREEVRLEPYGQLAGQEVEQQPVLPLARRIAPVAPHDPDPAEADPLVAADRALVRRGGVDRQAVVAALVDQVTRQRAHGVRAEALPVAFARDEDVDAGVAEVRRRLLVELDHPDGATVDLDGQADRVVLLAAGLLGEIGDARCRATSARPPGRRRSRPGDRSRAPRAGAAEPVLPEASAPSPCLSLPGCNTGA